MTDTTNAPVVATEAVEAIEATEPRSFLHPIPAYEPPAVQKLNTPQEHYSTDFAQYALEVKRLVKLNNDQCNNKDWTNALVSAKELEAATVKLTVSIKAHGDWEANDRAARNASAD